MTYQRAAFAAATVGVVSAGLLAIAAPANAKAAVSAHFSNGHGVLSVVGDDTGNQIVVGRDTGGAISVVVNGEEIHIKGAKPTVANVNLIALTGGAGDDTLIIDETNGAMPTAELSGGAGNDQLIAGSGDDTLTGGPGDDTVLGGAGNDRLVWNPGDGSDVDESGAGDDTVLINGSDAAETFLVSTDGTQVRFDRVDAAPFTVDIGGAENLVVNANGGDDHVSTSGNLAALIALTVDGGPGNDTLLGSNGADTLIGGPGDDFVDGNGGADLALLGDGNDTFQWDPGDGSDTVEGDAGDDTLRFNGSNANEQMQILAEGSHVHFLRDVANIDMDLTGIERLDTQALGGADRIVVGDLSGTDLTAVNLDLAGVAGGPTGDGQSDAVIVNGTDNADVVQLTGSQPDGVTVTGLPALVKVTGTDGPIDTLTVNGLGGDDAVVASGLAAGAVTLTEDGGAGNDVLTGSDGDDVLLGGSDDDVLIGGPGDDTLDGGTGNNILIQ
jgi:Ca2+-binding RTX toxin-like protein